MDFHDVGEESALAAAFRRFMAGYTGSSAVEDLQAYQGTGLVVGAGRRADDAFHEGFDSRGVLRRTVLSGSVWSATNSLSMNSRSSGMAVSMRGIVVLSMPHAPLVPRGRSIQHSGPLARELLSERN